jgi:uncharacterized protein YndB with AHSA1/START domain
MADQNIRELTLTRTFDSPRKLVFKAWTDPKLVTQWWGPNGVTTPICEVDANVGGLIYIVMEAGEELGKFKGTKWPMKGIFEEIVEPSKIVFSATAINNDKPFLENLTTVTFEELGGKTKMTVHILITKALPGAEGALAGMEQGWNQQLDKLVIFVPTL